MLGHEFSDPALLERALTHRSRGADNYERLEFLGDSILGFVVAEYLYHTYPDVSEGRLSRMRSSLVRKETLAKVARELGLSEFLILGEGELKSGGFNRSSILADSVESIIGAMYLDAGLEVAKQFIERHFQVFFADISTEMNYKDAKSRLQEAMQKNGFPLPIYQIIETTGAQHKQHFTVQCCLTEPKMQTHATARSRREAEQKAADQALAIFKSQSQT